MLCVLWLGSSVGNLKPHEAVGFFQSMQTSAGSNTQVLYSWLRVFPLCTLREVATFFSKICNKEDEVSGITLQHCLLNRDAHSLQAFARLFIGLLSAYVAIQWLTARLNKDVARACSSHTEALHTLCMPS